MSFQAVRGAKDILPDEISYFQMMESAARSVFARYGYSEIRTPIFEYTEVFTRSIGEETDIVSKEMYTFPDRKGRSLTLRPEGTAPVVRAMIEHNILKAQPQTKVYYIGPMFRYERPQAGRQRQFNTAGVEFFGCPSPLADAEVIVMLNAYLAALGFGATTVKINSIGNSESRQAYNTELRRRLAAVKDRLCPDCQRRAEVNPLRVLDCKVPEDQALYKDFPPLSEFLDAPSRAHFDTVLAALDQLGVSYVRTPNLVRGFDYYSHTVFETCLEGLGSQDAVLGGGRYDGLVEELGGPATPAVGAGFGLERLLLAMKARNIVPPTDPETDRAIYVIALDDTCLVAGAKLAESIRASGRKAVFDLVSRSIKAGLRSANKIGASRVAIIGAEELSAGVAVFKNLEDGKEKRVTLGDLASELV